MVLLNIAKNMFKPAVAVIDDLPQYNFDNFDMKVNPGAVVIDAISEYRDFMSLIRTDECTRDKYAIVCGMSIWDKDELLFENGLYFITREQFYAIKGLRYNLDSAQFKCNVKDGTAKYVRLGSGERYRLPRISAMHSIPIHSRGKIIGFVFQQTHILAK